MVHNGRVYLYTGHDEDGSTYFTMKEWRVVLLRRHGELDRPRLADEPSHLQLGRAPTPGPARSSHRNGKFYWYVPVTQPRDRRDGHRGRRVRPAPPGPFRDALGRPLVENGEIDPTVFIDDDGQAYLYWGNPRPVVRPAERRHDLLLGQPHPDPADHRGIRHPHRQRQPPDAVRRGALGLQAQRPVLQRVRGRMLLRVHRLLDRSRPDRAVDLPRDGHAHGRAAASPTTPASSTSTAARTSSTTTARCRAAAATPARSPWRGSPTTPTARSRRST